jgi:hypothetical protein
MLTRTDRLVGVGDAEEGVPAGFTTGSLRHVTSVEPVSTSERGRRESSPLRRVSLVVCPQEAPPSIQPGRSNDNPGNRVTPGGEGHR